MTEPIWGRRGWGVSVTPVPSRSSEDERVVVSIIKPGLWRRQTSVELSTEDAEQLLAQFRDALERLRKRQATQPVNEAHPLPDEARPLRRADGG